MDKKVKAAFEQQRAAAAARAQALEDEKNAAKVLVEQTVRFTAASPEELDLCARSKH